MKLFSQCFWITLFFIVVGVFFYPTILKGKIPVPSDTLVGLYHPWRDFYAQYPRGIPFKNFLITDPVRQQIPWRKSAIDQWKKGEFPAWNPFSFSGISLVGNIQAAVFYPLNVLFFVFSFPIAWTILILLEPIMGGVFFYFYLKNQKHSPWASTLGSIVWSFCGFNISWLTWGTITHVALWFPLVLLSIDKVIEFSGTNTFWNVALLLSFVFSFFAGHAQVFFYLLLLSISYGFWRYRIRTPKKFSMMTFLWITGIFVVLTSIQWIPFARQLFLSSRIADTLSWKQAGWFLPWQNLVQFIAPDFFGNPATLNYWGIWNYGEFIGYIGICGLLLVVLTLLNREKTSRFWILVLFVAFLFLLPNPLSKIVYQVRLPILSSMQPTRLMVIIDFALAVLVSLGADQFMKQPKRSIFYGIMGLGLLFVLLWTGVLVIIKKNPNQELVSHLLIAKNNLILPTALFVASSFLLAGWKLLEKRKKITIVFQMASVVLISFDLLRFGWKFSPFTPMEYFFPKTPAIAFLEKQQKPFRIAVLDNRILPPNSSGYYGLESIEGYDPVYSGKYEEFIAASERDKADITPPYGFNRIITPHNVDSPLLPILNVRYVVSFGELNRPYLTKVFQEGQTIIYEDTRSLPRFYFVERVTIEENKQKILDDLFGKTFHPSQTAFVEKPVSLIPSPIQSNEYAVITSYADSEIKLDVQTLNSRFLVVSNIYDDGWVADIDGKKMPIYRTDYVLQGIIVPSGRHTVTLRYRG